METTQTITAGTQWQRVDAAERITIGRRTKTDLVQLCPAITGRTYFMRPDVFLAKFRPVA
jgi:hypothetical protein